MNINKYNILCVCTSSAQSTWGALTGLWLEELIIPYYIFIEAGYRVNIATVCGGAPPVDPACNNVCTDTTTRSRYLADTYLQQKLNSAPSLRNILSNEDLSSYSCIYLCGGHGCFGDYLNNVELTQIVEAIYNSTKGCVGAICHGPLGLISCKTNDGKALLKGKFVAAFSNEEEELLSLTVHIPCSVEDEMDKAGAICVPNQPWKPNAVVDGRLVTGQNPQSSLEISHRILDVLRSLGPIYSPPENANKPWGE